MDFWQVIGDRYSVRNFDPSVKVSEEVVVRLLAAAVRAPSAGNRQPWHFYVVRDAGVREGLAAAAYGQGFITQAPVAIVVCADAEKSAARYGDRGRDLYCLQDTAAATEHILLTAVAEGFGGCWVGAFDESQARKVLGLPAGHRPVAIVALGKPVRTRGSHSSREPLDQVASFIG